MSLGFQRIETATVVSGTNVFSISFGELMDRLPMWSIYPVTLALAMLAIEAGYLLGKRWQRRSHVSKEGAVGAMTGSTLGLLAFLLAFITGLAVNRFDNRRSLVVEEANAIGTTYLRAGFLDETARDQSRDLLREYVQIRLDAPDSSELESVIVRSEEIQNELWTTAEIIARDNMDSPVIATYIETLNQMIDLHAKRVIAITSSRIPGSIWTGIYIVAGLSMVLVGMLSSFGERPNWLATILLALVFAAVLTLIVDLDRPEQGLLTVSQQALLDLQAQIGAWSP